MSWGLIASAAISVGGSLLASDSANDAASTQSNASLEAARLQDEAQKRLEQRMQPYIATGNAADTYINSLLGLPAPQASGAGGASATAGAPDYAAYVNNNPDLLAAYQAESQRRSTFGVRGAGELIDGGGRVRSIEDFGRWHYQAHGQSEGRALPTIGATTGQPAQTSAQTYDAAMAAYENSPWAKFAREGAETSRKNANESFMSTAGARGSIVSGRTAAGLYDIAQEAEDQRFREGFTESWYPAMTGVSDRGYNASVGVGNSSLSTAANIAAATERAGSARADGQRAASDAMATGINSALYYAGQGYDAWQNRNPSSSVSKTSKAGKGSGGGSTKYSGG